MEINGPPPIALTPRQLRSAIDSWQVGQILQARVIRQTTPQTLLLQLNDQQLLAESNVRLAPGQRLELTVAQLGDKPVLQARLLPAVGTPATSPPAGTTQAAGAPAVARDALPAPAVPPERPPPAPPSDHQAAINTLLKQALPKQASMAGLLANIALLNNQPGRAASLPAPLEAIVKQLYRQLPAAERIGHAAQLRQAVSQSGIFLENRLSAGARPAVDPKALPPPLPGGGGTPATLPADLKADLLRLLAAVQQVARPTPPQGSPPTPPLPFVPPPLRGQPPQPQARAEATLPQLGTLQLLLLELGRQAEAALARTQLHQAASLPGNEQSGASWALELPLRHNQQIDLFDMVIEEEDSRAQEEDAAHPWSVTVAFDLDGLGPVYARLRLVNERVSTLFWAEREDTTQLFNRHLDELQQRYREHGVEPAELRCFQGPPPESAARRSHIVLDVKA